MQSPSWEMKWKHPCRQLFKPKSASSLRTLIKHSWWGSLKRLQHPFWRVTISQSRSHMSNASVHVGFPSIPNYFRVTGKLRETHSESIANYIQKKIGFLEEHSPHIINVSWIFLHPFANFLSTLKGNTKIWLYTGGGRRRASRVSYFSLGISFQWLCQSRSNPPVVIVLPSPKWYLTAWMNKSA